MNDDLPPWLLDGSQNGSQNGNNDDAPWTNDNSGYDRNFNNSERALRVDCKWSEWTTNEPCSQSCGHGIQEYKRTNLVESKNGGLECVGSFQKTESCNIQDCPVDCQWSQWTKHGHCSRLVMDVLTNFGLAS